MPLSTGVKSTTSKISTIIRHISATPHSRLGDAQLHVVLIKSKIERHQAFGTFKDNMGDNIGNSSELHLLEGEPRPAGVTPLNMLRANQLALRSRDIPYAPQVSDSLTLRCHSARPHCSQRSPHPLPPVHSLEGPG